MADDNLSIRDGSIADVAAYTASGDTAKLEEAVRAGLKNGMTVNEIKEVMVQLYAYCGFPRSLNALGVLMKVAKEGGFKEGESGKALPADADRLKLGTKVQTELVGSEVKGPLFDFAPAIDEYLKTHLFGDIFARGVLSTRERELATIAALSALGTVEPQLAAHITIGKRHGVTDAQVRQMLARSSLPRDPLFGMGEPNDAYARYFIGKSYLRSIVSDQLNVANVTFEPGCRNNWHIHHKGGQILLVTGGRGYYQAWGQEARELKAGDSVSIPAEVKHWHGAAGDSWFTHIAIGVPAEGASTEWLEPVSDEEYGKLK